MATIRVHTVDGNLKCVPISSAVSLANTLLAAGFPLRHRCGGKMECGTCRVTIVYADSRKSGTNTAGEGELYRLAQIGADPEAGNRLACQTYVYADVDVYLFR